MAHSADFFEALARLADQAAGEAYLARRDRVHDRARQGRDLAERALELERHRWNLLDRMAADR